MTTVERAVGSAHIDSMHVGDIHGALGTTARLTPLSRFRLVMRGYLAAAVTLVVVRVAQLALHHG
jgi:hypothetical protein